MMEHRERERERDSQLEKQVPGNNIEGKFKENGILK